MKRSIGILGGGQLGKMLHSAGAQLDLEMHFLDSMTSGPVANISKNYKVGSIESYTDVKAFAKTSDVMTIEIEKVNVPALKELEKEGKLVFPQPHLIEIIQDKGLQKQFYTDHNLPTTSFSNYVDLHQLQEDLNKERWTFPFVQKLRKDGYDGRGVQIIRNTKDLSRSFDQPFLVEAMVEIKKELAVVTCSDQDGNIAVYDPVEMVFHPEANILLYQLGPARIDPEMAEKAKQLALRTVRAFEIVGLLAIEMFVSVEDEVMINEVAPRPHNSGHHTIEAAEISQYENHLRAISGLPLGSAVTTRKSLLMNILGDESYSGTVYYEGLNEVLALPGVHVHIYGKKETRPFRKMGHITITADNYDQLIQYYDYIHRTLRVITR